MVTRSTNICEGKKQKQEMHNNGPVIIIFYSPKSVKAYSMHDAALDYYIYNVLVILRLRFGRYAARPMRRPDPRCRVLDDPFSSPWEAGSSSMMASCM